MSFYYFKLELDYFTFGQVVIGHMSSLWPGHCSPVFVLHQPRHMLTLNTNMFQCLQVDYPKLSVGSAMVNSHHEVYGTPLTSCLRIWPSSQTMRTVFLSPPSSSTMTSRGWWGSHWTETPGCQSLSVRNVTPTSTNVTASCSGFSRELTCCLSAKKTLETGKYDQIYN